jgi:hypothetical protein
MKKTQKKIVVAGIMTLMVCCIGWLAMGLGHRQKTAYHLPAKAARTEVKEPLPVYDPALLKKFTDGVRSLDFNRVHCTYAGLINMVDPNDTTNTVHDLHFSFCRSGNDYYYRLGGVEIVHENNVNLYIQNDQHKVVLSSLQINIPTPVKNMDVIIKALQSENYVLSCSLKGNRQTLKIVNEKHLSCKELSVTLDTLTGKLERIYTRLNDFGSMMDKGKDRVIDVQVSEISNRINKTLFPSVSSVLSGANDRWSLTGKYKNYELIRL